MLRTLAIASATVLLGTVLLVPQNGYAEDQPPSHPGPWPIWHWQNHQPTQAQLQAMHAQDVTAEQARKVEQLYWELEGFSPKGTDNCEARAIPPEQRAECRAEGGANARVLPSRPLPSVMAPAH